MRLLSATLLLAACTALQLPTRRHIRTTKRYTATADPPAAELAEERRSWRRRKRSEVLVFAAPALSTVLADPLMSMFDALVCGRSCSTLEFASLGPALAVFNFVNYGFFFLNAATTVNVAAALARDNKKAATETLSGAVSVAALCGLDLQLHLQRPLGLLLGLLLPLLGLYRQLLHLGLLALADAEELPLMHFRGALGLQQCQLFRLLHLGQARGRASALARLGGHQLGRDRVETGGELSLIHI